MSDEHQPALDDLPLVSAIIPCRNEASWIARCVASVAANDYPRCRLEVLVVDGMSDDGTRGVVEELAKQHPYVRLLDNPEQITSTAANIGIRASRGEVVVILGAHAEYAADYISRLVGWLRQSGADNVGGVCVTRAGTETPMGRAIATGLTSRLGVGNAHFRLGVSQPRLVDTVAFGCYRRSVFDRIGLFDEELTRNQDLEFNLRLRKHGGKILLVPDVTTQYYARDSLAKLARMTFQNAYFSPLVARKLRGTITLRQVIPAAFLLTIVGLGLLSTAVAAARWLLGFVVLAYVGPLAGLCLVAARREGALCGLALAAVIPTMHLSHGLGFLKGAVDFLVLRRNARGLSSNVPLTR